ncbi:MAG: MoxR family ATPase, partial [Bacteroidota bacterium]
DEIDKAPRDLPHDGLYALENLEFNVPEANKTFRADPAQRPFVIMTSNSEKNLPEPFLRRVAFYHINFPDDKTLLRILQSKTDGYTEAQLQPLVKLFEKIRTGRKTKLKKNPATAELLNWVDLLRRLGFDPSELTGTLTAGGKEKLELSWSVLAKNKEDLELLKNLNVAGLSLA